MIQQNLVRFQHEVLHEPGVIVLDSLDGVQVCRARCASASTNSRLVPTIFVYQNLRSLIIDSPALRCAAPPTWPTSAAAQVAVALVQARLGAVLPRQRSDEEAASMHLKPWTRRASASSSQAEVMFMFLTCGPRHSILFGVFKKAIAWFMHCYLLQELSQVCVCCRQR